MRPSDVPGLLQLPIDEKLRFVEELWDDIMSHESDVPVPQEHKDELDRRWAEYEASGAKLATWNEVEERIRRRRNK